MLFSAVFKHTFMSLGLLALLTACVSTPGNGPVPTATALPASESAEAQAIYQTQISPDQSHLAIWRYHPRDSFAPFYDLSQSEILILNLATQQVVYQLPWTAFTHNGLASKAADQLWWQNNQTLLLTGETDGKRFIEQIQVSARNHRRLYTFPGPLSAFLPRQDNLYLLSENRLEHLNLQTLQQATLAEFAGQAELLYPTHHADLWILGARNDFSLKLLPLPAPDYYLLDLTTPQAPHLRQCQLDNTAASETAPEGLQRFMLAVNLPQTLLFCP